MDIKILDSWLREYLVTKADPPKIAEHLSLCGPSVEKIEKYGKDTVYNIEITTNRIDSASVYGIAREAAAILPRFKVAAKLKAIKQELKPHNFVNKVKYLDVTVDSNLCQRFTAVLIRDVKIGDSPQYIQDRLQSAGVRALNNIVDISNYIMIGLGQPVHTFDYDKIMGSKMVLRASRVGEKITTLDGKEFTLPGGDIVIEDGEGRLIDLAGVMGGNLSAVDSNTKNVLLFVQTYNPTNIRKTSMLLAQRTVAATIFEKGTDPELVTEGILTGVDLFKSLTGGVPEKDVLNIYPNPYKAKKIEVREEFIEKHLGIKISKGEISTILKSLQFESAWHGDTLTTFVPSFRARDFSGPEDVLEEIARIYGYHNLPSEIMTGPIPSQAPNSLFNFERKVKTTLEGFGGVEVYTSSLVPKEFTDQPALKLKNPLGNESEYLRTSLMPSLVSAAKENLGAFEAFHLFEMSNVYIPKTNDLPLEKLMLGGIFSGYSYQDAKGIVEGLIEKLNIDCKFEAHDTKGFSASRVALITTSGREIGLIGYLDSNLIYYEFAVEGLFEGVEAAEFKEISKYPSQIEDLTFYLPEKTKVGDVVESMITFHQHILEVGYVGDFKGNYTFKIKYHNPSGTLTNEDVNKIRLGLINSVKSKFGGQIKS